MPGILSRFTLPAYWLSQLSVFALGLAIYATLYLMVYSQQGETQTPVFYAAFGWFCLFYLALALGGMVVHTPSRRTAVFTAIGFLCGLDISALVAALVLLSIDSTLHGAGLATMPHLLWWALLPALSLVAAYSMVPHAIGMALQQK